MTITNIVSANPTGSFEFDAVQGGVSSHVRVDVRTGLKLADFPYQEGQKVNVQGVSAIFNGVYQLKPRGLTDFSEAAPPLAQGAPGKPVLSDNNGHDTGLRDGSYTISMNMWWGTNATEYRLFENGQLIESKPLTASTPNAQKSTTELTGKTPGVYEYRIELVNTSGVTSSDTLVVTVTK